MKHATAVALQQISELIARIRMREGLREKCAGVFYRKSKAFLHFHEGPMGIFADLRTGEEFERLSVNTEKDQSDLLSQIDNILASAVQPTSR